MNRHLLGDDAAFLGRGLACMAPRHIHAHHDGPVFRGDHTDDLALLALVLAGNDDDLVALADFKLRRHHTTSGASETIFIWVFPRSSRGTSPKMRVPTRSPCA